MSRLTVRGATSQRDINRLFELSNDNQFGRNEAYYKLQHYEDLEEQLEKLYGGKMPLDEVVENLNRVVQNGEEKLDYARILTNAEAEKWDKWKDLEEQGRLLELPCAVGDTVWLIGKNYNKCTKHYDCEHYDYNEYLIIWCEKNCPNGFRGTGVIQATIETIEINRGQVLVQLNAHDNYLRVPIKSVFLTQEEAEAKLKGMEGAK